MRNLDFSAVLIGADSTGTDPLDLLQAEDQLVDLVGSNRIEPRRRFIKEHDSGSRSWARANPTRFFLPSIIIGGHVVLVDSGYRVHDIIRFELNFGR